MGAGWVGKKQHTARARHLSVRLALLGIEEMAAGTCSKPSWSERNFPDVHAKTLVQAWWSATRIACRVTLRSLNCSSIFT